ncbi:MAG: hypothetical protein ACKOB6_08245 [Candidatus Kapaibacterium sp.]
MESLAVGLHTGALADHARLVVPHGRLARSVADRMVRAVCEATGGPSLAFRVETMQTLLRSLHGLVADPTQPPVSNAPRYLLLRSAITDNKRLRYYRTRTRELTDAVTESIYRTVTDLIRRGYDARRFDALRHDAAVTVGDAATPSDDVSAVLHAYESLLGSKRVDIPGMITSVSTRLPGIGAPAMPSLPLPSCVIFDGFVHVAGPEAEVLRGLAASGIPTAMYLTEDESTDPHGTARLLTDMGYGSVSCGTSASESSATGASSLRSASVLRVQRLSEALAAEAVAQVQTPAVTDATVNILVARDKTDEIRRIARYVKHCVRTEGMSPDAIAVVCADADSTAHLLEQEFRDSGIPASCQDTRLLSTSPVVHGFFAAVDCAVRAYLREDVENVLSNPWLDVHPDNGRLDVTGLQHAARELRLTGGPANDGIKGWIEALTRAVKRAEGSVTTDADTEEGSVSYTAAARLYRKALTDLDHLRQLLPDPNEMMTPQVFRERCRGLWTSVGIQRKLDDLVRTRTANAGMDRPDMADREDLLRVSRAAATFLGLIDELQAAEKESGHDRRTFREYAGDLRTLVHQTVMSVPERAGSGVHIGAPGGIVGMPYRMVIITGML